MKTGKKMRIGEVAQHLNIKRSVIKTWEKEFNINSENLSNDHHIYNQDDILKFKTIKDLLHNQKLTLAQAKEKFNNGDIIASQALISRPVTTEQPERIILAEKIHILQKQLIKLRELL